MTGAASMSAPTAAGDRAATVGTSSPWLAELLLKVATMQPGASPVVKSVTAGKAPAGYSASKLRVTGQICVVPMPGRLCLEQRPALREGRRCDHRQPLHYPRHRDRHRYIEHRG